MLFQYAEGARFRASHRAFLLRDQIIVAGEVEPAVHEVQRQLGAEIAPMFSGVRGRSVGGNADLPRGSQIRISLEGDDVGGGGIVEKIGVQSCEFRVGENDEGKFARGHGCGRKADCGCVPVEQCDDARNRLRIDAQTGMPVCDRDFARGRGRDSAG
jgi:hypothetical protein